MAVACVADLVEALRRFQLVEPGRLDELASGLAAGGQEPADWANALIRRGWLTRFQADYLLEGRGHELALGPYLLLERLGKGGMGEVFKARQRRLDRIVALKIIRPDHLNHPDIMTRFRREARAAARLQHPNIVTIYDTDEADGIFFIVMEHVEGTDLAQLVKQAGPLPVGDACEYARQAALGLQHAHEHGLVHRDIKPSNLIVTRPSAVGDGFGLVKVLDFGLARFASELSEDGGLTPTDQWLGTPDFIAPEQAQSSKDVDIRADIFSLGCALYYLLTGKSAFAGHNKMEKLVARLTSDVTPASSFREQVSPPLDAVLMRMLARDPAKRYQTPVEVARALEPFCRPALSPVTGAQLRTAVAVAGEQPTVSEARAADAPTPMPAVRRQDSGPTPLAPTLLPVTPATPSATSLLSKPLRRHPRLILGAGIVIVLVLAGLAAAPLLLKKNDRVAVVPAEPPQSFVNSIGMKLLRIPAGAFLMGAPANEPEQGEDEVPQHPVEIKKPFYMGAYEVTQAEYQAVMNVNPSHFSPLGAGAAKLEGIADPGKLPVDSVSWDDAGEFCRRLTAREPKESRTYRLPTEAEWEYACRAKTTTPFYLGKQLSAADANFDGRRPYGGAPAGAAREATMPVGSFLPNAFGLYDMHGNVWEWCQDRYVSYADKLRPGGPDQGSGRIQRGGAWLFSGADCRSAKRTMRDQDNRSPYVGFRVVCEP